MSPADQIDPEPDPRLAAARRVAHVTLQPLASDARVNRAVSTMREAGLDCPIVGPGSGITERAMDRRSKLSIGATFGAARLIDGLSFGRAASKAAFFARPEHREALQSLIACRPDAIHAHDWDGVIVAARAAKTLGVPFVYDAHEFAAEMHAERRFWRATVAPLIRRLEGPAARKATRVVTVGDALSQLLTKELKLARRPITVRNIPDVANCPVEPRSGEEIHFLYHGVLAEGRGIEALVDGVLAASRPCRLTLRGPWRQQRLHDEIRARLASHPAAARVGIEPPVPFDELVSAAARSDVGVCLLDGRIAHNRIALPNKLFEYLHAGLAVVASGSDEMREIVETHGCGIDIGQAQATAVTAMIERTDRATIGRWRAAAGVAAQQFCWHSEKMRLLAIYGRG